MLALTDRIAWKLSKGICLLVKLFRKKQQEANVTCRGMRQSAEWHVSQARGDVLRPVLECFEILMEPNTFEDCGLTDKPSAAWKKQYGTDHGELLCQNSLAARFSTVACKLVYRNFNDVLWHMHGFPGVFPCVSVPDRAEAVLQDIQSYLTVWDNKVSNLRGWFWRKVQGRAYVNDPYCQKACQYCCHKHVF